MAHRNCDGPDTGVRALGEKNSAWLRDMAWPTGSVHSDQAQGTAPDRTKETDPGPHAATATGAVDRLNTKPMQDLSLQTTVVTETDRGDLAPIGKASKKGELIAVPERGHARSGHHGSNPSVTQRPVDSPE